MPSPPTSRKRDVEVLYLTDLLTETLEQEDARRHAIQEALGDLDLGDTMRGYLEGLLGDASPEELTVYLTAGIRNDEVRGGFGAGHLDARLRRLPDRPAAQPAVHAGLVGVGARPGRHHLAGHARPQARDRADRAPSTPGTRGSSVRRRCTARTSSTSRGRAPAGPRRDRGRRRGRTTPAGVERLARQCFQGRLAHTVLAVPIAQERATMHLDTICTLVDTDKMVVYPNVADSCWSRSPSRRPAMPEVDGDLVLEVGEARAVPARRREGDGHRHPRAHRHGPGPRDGRAGAVGRRQQHAGPGAAGGASPTSATTRPTPGSRTPASRWSGSPARSVGSGRGGPRCMSCPISRDPLA